MKKELQVWTRDGKAVWISYRLSKRESGSLMKIVAAVAVAIWCAVMWLGAIIAVSLSGVY